jgi:Leucine-rich repeat (LRR) protein
VYWLLPIFELSFVTLQLPPSVSFLNLSCNAVKLSSANMNSLQNLKQLWLADNNIVCMRDWHTSGTAPKQIK